MGATLIILFLIFFGFYLLYKWVHKMLTRKKLIKMPVPKNYIQFIKKNVALYNYLPENLRKELQGHINIFLKEKYFEGCGGLNLTDEIKVTIAAEACILLLNKAHPSYFPRCDAILVYPSAYVAENLTPMGVVHVKEQSVRLGESWTKGIVVLAWDHVKQNVLDVIGGHNVVLHEFAHQLDQEDGVGNGTPKLEKLSQYRTWGRVLSHDYEELREHMFHQKKDVLDYYGATNPAEFFAVATETFFERSHDMKRMHPDLFEQLKEYYKLDPSKWIK